MDYLAKISSDKSFLFKYWLVSCFMIAMGIFGGVLDRIYDWWGPQPDYARVFARDLYSEFRTVTGMEKVTYHEFEVSPDFWRQYIDEQSKNPATVWKNEIQDRSRTNLNKEVAYVRFVLLRDLKVLAIQFYERTIGQHHYIGKAIVVELETWDKLAFGYLLNLPEFELENLHWRSNRPPDLSPFYAGFYEVMNLWRSKPEAFKMETIEKRLRIRLAAGFWDIQDKLWKFRIFFLAIGLILFLASFWQLWLLFRRFTDLKLEPYARGNGISLRSPSLLFISFFLTANLTELEAGEFKNLQQKAVRQVKTRKNDGTRAVEAATTGLKTDPEEFRRAKVLSLKNQFERLARDGVIDDAAKLYQQALVEEDLGKKKRLLKDAISRIYLSTHPAGAEQISEDRHLAPGEDTTGARIRFITYSQHIEDALQIADVFISAAGLNPEMIKTILACLLKKHRIGGYFLSCNELRKNVLRQYISRNEPFDPVLFNRMLNWLAREGVVLAKDKSGLKHEFLYSLCVKQGNAGSEAAAELIRSVLGILQGFSRTQSA